MHPDDPSCNAGRAPRRLLPCIAVFDPDERQVAILLDRLPTELNHVRRLVATGVPRIEALGHMHAVPTILYCLAGTMRHLTPNGPVDLKPGEALLIGPAVWHHHEQPKPGCVSLSQGLFATTSDVVLRTDRRKWLGLAQHEPTRAKLEEALAAPEDQLVRIVRELLTDTFSRPIRQHQGWDAEVEKMLVKMWWRCHVGITVDDMIAASGLGRTQAYQRFLAQFGISPAEAMRQMRLGLANAMVAAGVTPAEAALAAGFPSLRAFQRTAHGKG